MTESNAEIGKIIDLLFEPDKIPFFIDDSAAVELFLDPNGDGWLKPCDFLIRASEEFGTPLTEEHLKLTIPQLADYLRNR